MLFIHKKAKPWEKELQWMCRHQTPKHKIVVFVIFLSLLYLWQSTIFGGAGMNISTRRRSIMYLELCGAPLLICNLQLLVGRALPELIIIGPWFGVGLRLENS
ncbi:hypothetical protein ACH5RR_001134 [Cinchona calisaya]|uniref:Uncharacterized protein n=1 Tax=Cinchona calisaya TaxID=153742 RepID=A0ABD3B3B9_9GENT